MYEITPFFVCKRIYYPFVLHFVNFSFRFVAQGNIF